MGGGGDEGWSECEAFTGIGKVCYTMYINEIIRVTKSCLRSRIELQSSRSAISGHRSSSYRFYLR